MDREKLSRHEEEKGKKNLKMAQDDLRRKEAAQAKAAAELERFTGDIAETEAAAEAFERGVVEEMARSSAGKAVTQADIREFEAKEREVAKRTNAEQRALGDKARRLESGCGSSGGACLPCSAGSVSC